MPFDTLPGAGRINYPIQNYPTIPPRPVIPTAAFAAQIAKLIEDMSPEERQKRKLQLELLGLSSKRNQQSLDIGELQKQYYQGLLNHHSRNHNTAKLYDAIDNAGSTSTTSSPASVGSDTLSPNRNYKERVLPEQAVQPNEAVVVPDQTAQPISQQLPNDAPDVAKLAMAVFPHNDRWDTHPMDAYSET